MNSKINYITIRKVQQDLYQAYWRGTTRPVCNLKTNTPIQCFNSKKDAKDYLNKTEVI